MYETTIIKYQYIRFSIRQKKEEGGRVMKKNLASQEDFDKADPVLETLKIHVLTSRYASEEKCMHTVKETEMHPSIKNHLLDYLHRCQSEFSSITHRNNRLVEEIEKNLSYKQQNTVDASSNTLFSILTRGSSLDGLVFTVIAENEVCAEKMVRQWLNSNGKEKHKIDKLMALVSQDVRAIVNVGAELLDA